MLSFRTEKQARCLPGRELAGLSSYPTPGTWAALVWCLGKGTTKSYTSNFFFFFPLKHHCSFQEKAALYPLQPPAGLKNKRALHVFTAASPAWPGSGAPPGPCHGVIGKCNRLTERLPKSAITRTTELNCCILSLLLWGFILIFFVSDPRRTNPSHSPALRVLSETRL